MNENYIILKFYNGTTDYDEELAEIVIPEVVDKSAIRSLVSSIEYKLLNRYGYSEGIPYRN